MMDFFHDLAMNHLPVLFLGAGALSVALAWVLIWLAEASADRTIARLKREGRWPGMSGATGAPKYRPARRNR